VLIERMPSLADVMAFKMAGFLTGGLLDKQPAHKLHFEPQTRKFSNINFRMVALMLTLDRLRTAITVKLSKT
jgi:hypothetical protein